MFYLKNTIRKECQAEYLANTKQVGGDFCQQQATLTILNMS